MTSPRVSIFTPTYNHERFIRSAAESVMNQEYDNWEMLIIDDESQDSTWSIVRDLCKQDSRIRGFRNAHQGIWNLGNIYNEAMKNSDGDLIAILDGDDFWPLDKLRIQVPAHLDLGVGVTFGRRQTVGVDSQLLHSPNGLDLTAFGAKEIALALLEGRFMFPAVSLLMNRSSIEKVGGFAQPPYLPLVDYPIVLNIGFRDGLGYVDRILGYWRQYPGQTTWQLSRECVLGSIRFSKDFILENQSVLGDKWESVLEASQSNRLPILVDALYREVISATDNGDIHKVRRSMMELKKLDFRMYLRANVVRSGKSLRTLGRRLLQADLK